MSEPDSRGHKMGTVVGPNGKPITLSRGGLVVWLERTPAGESVMTLSCASHRTWAIECVIPLDGGDAYRNRMHEIAMRDAFDSRESCTCATPLRIT